MYLDLKTKVDVLKQSGNSTLQLDVNCDFGQNKYTL